MPIDPNTQAAGSHAAAAKRSKASQERRAIERALAEAPLETPADIRQYLQTLLRAVSTGALDSRAAAAGASVASKLLRAIEVDVSDRLDELERAAKAGGTVVPGGITRRIGAGR
jgi:GH24 family phage-related lysozyme (muramidase)